MHFTRAAAEHGQPESGPPAVQRLAAKTLRVYEAPEADQGVAVDVRHFYPVDNTVIAKYDIATGMLIDRWVGPEGGLVRHLNSCLIDVGRLWCANSNYPQTPMGSSVEVFDTATLDHVDTHSLGMTEEGSLTWFDRHRGGWVAGFAHYDREDSVKPQDGSLKPQEGSVKPQDGSLGYKDHAFSSVVTFDAEWRRTGGWLFPASTLERMAPNAASGGAIGPDGWLYLLGHDRPELYVVGRPPMGPTLIHLATVDLEAEGQAFAWAQDGTRSVFTIDRRKGLVRRVEIPVVTVSAPQVARPFR
jgi:hypothetical protein